MLGACALLASTDAQAQLNDDTQAPNPTLFDDPNDPE
jgi:hypothetical protein